MTDIDLPCNAKMQGIKIANSMTVWQYRYILVVAVLSAKWGKNARGFWRLPTKIRGMGNHHQKLHLLWQNQKYPAQFRQSPYKNLLWKS